MIVVENGVVTCVNTVCSTANVAANYTIAGGRSISSSTCNFSEANFQLASEKFKWMKKCDSIVGIVIPGMINTAAPTGLVEVDSEDNSADGVASMITTPDIKAIDGVMFNTFAPRHLRAAWAGGVTTIVTGPMGTNLISGVSVAFYSQGVTIDDALVKEEVALHVNVGNDAKASGYSASISGQIASLRSMFLSANGTGNSIENSVL